MLVYVILWGFVFVLLVVFGWLVLLLGFWVLSFFYFSPWDSKLVPSYTKDLSIILEIAYAGQKAAWKRQHQVCHI